MSSSLTKDNLFKPSRSKAETKAETTDNAARQIIAGQAAQREAKSARLRAARLEQEARQQELDDAQAKTEEKPKRKRAAAKKA